MSFYNREVVCLHIRSACFVLIFVFYYFCFELRKLPVAWKYTGWPILKALTFKSITRFHSYGGKKFCRKEKTFVLLEVYRNMRPDFSGQRIATLRSLQKPAWPLPHLAFKNTLVKPMREFGGLQTTHLLAWPCNKPLSAQILGFGIVWSHCVLGIWTSIQ